MRLSTPYKSVDGQTLYANEERSGSRRRVRWDGPRLVLQQRIGKAAKKAAKRARHRG